MKIPKILILTFLLCILLPRASFALNEEEERFYVATKAFSDSFYEASISLFERFIQEFPQSKRTYEAKLYIAKCNYFRQNYPRVLEILNELAANPDARLLHDEVYYWLAEVSFKGKNYKDTRNYSRKLISNFPNSKFLWLTYYLLASSNLELQENDKAIDIFEKIIHESPEREVVEKSYGQLFEIYYQKNDFFQVTNVAKNYIKDFPRGTLEAQARFYLGESYGAQNKFDQAIEAYQRGLELTTNSYLSDLIHRGLGFLYLANGKSTEAKKHIDSIKNEELRAFSQATYSLKMKDYPTALEKFTDFVKNFPSSPFIGNVYLNKAATLYEMGRVNDSIGTYQYLLDTFKGTQDAELLDKTHYGLAWGYLKSGEYKKAIVEFEQTLKYTGNPVVKVSSQIQIADAYQEGGEYVKALDMYNDVLKSNPNTIYSDYIQFQIGMVFLKTKRLEESLVALHNLQKNFPSSRLLPEAQYYLAVAYFSMDKYHEAQSLIEEFMTKYPSSEYLSKAFYLYGKTFFNQKDYNAAIAIFKEIAQKTTVKDLQDLVCIDIGNAYLNLSMFDQAKKTWEDFLTKFPKSQYAPSVALHLGGLYEKEENYLEAEKYYLKVVTDYGETPWTKEAILSLGHLYWRQGNLEKAEEYFKKITSSDEPIALKTKLYLSKVYIQKGNTAQALKIYNELINSSSSISKIAVLEKAFLLKDENDYETAVTLFKKTIRDGIDSPRIRLNLGACLEKLNRNNEALDVYLALIYSFSDTSYRAKAYFRIARLYEKKGDIEAAKEIYKKIITLNIDEGRIAQARLEQLGNKE